VDSDRKRNWRNGAAIYNPQDPDVVTGTRPANLSDTQCPKLIEEHITSITPPNGLVTPGTEVFFDGSWNQCPPQDTLALSRIPATKDPDDHYLEYAFPVNDSINGVQLFSDETTFVSQVDWELDLSDHGVLPPSSSSIGGNQSSTGSTTFENHNLLWERGTSTRMLLDLASDLHERLEALEKGTWQQEETHNALDNYPIGSVLHLSQKFTNLANALRRAGPSSEEAVASSRGSPMNCEAHSIHVPDSERSRNDSIATGGLSSSSDPSVTLILLSSYITLTRIYTIVLGHFQRHLNLQPNAWVRAPPPSLDPGPTVCLGELPMIDASYSRTHTAIRMVLDSLGRAEDALGLHLPQIHSPDDHESLRSGSTDIKALSDVQVKPDLAIAVIHREVLTGAGSIKEVLTTLGKRVTDIKELLREKMGL
jgi:hypothetical protein